MLLKKFKYSIGSEDKINVIALPHGNFQHPQSYNLFVEDKLVGTLPKHSIENDDNVEDISLEISLGCWYITNNMIGRYDGQSVYNLDEAIILNDAVDFSGSEYEYVGQVSPRLIDIRRKAQRGEIHGTLNVVANYKGYTEGTVIKSVNDGKKIELTNNYRMYGPQDDCLIGNKTNCGAKGIIYQFGKWAEIIDQQPLMTTTDGYEIYDENQWLYFPQIDIFKVRSFPQIDIFKVRSFLKGRQTEVNFYNKENAIRYIEDTKLRYNNSDLEWIYTEYVKRIDPKIEFKNCMSEIIEELKESKHK